MCRFCDTADANIKNTCKDYYIHNPFIVSDEHNQEVLEPDENNPIMYLREYTKGDMKGLWSLVCEFADDNGTVIETRVGCCPMCGRKLTKIN